jgi:hypothetical protein
LTKGYITRFCLGFLVLGGVTVRAGTVTITPNFGTGTGVTGFTWPGTSNASGSTTGVPLTGPIELDGGALVITGNASVDCAVGTTAGTCGDATGLSNLTAYGLGIGDARIDSGETLTITVQPGFNVISVELVSFSLTGFTTNGAPGGVPEVATFVLDGGSTNSFTATGSSTATPKTDTPDLNFTNTLLFGSSAGNYSLASLDLIVTTADSTAPEPATFGLAGLALAAIGVARRKRRI